MSKQITVQSLKERLCPGVNYAWRDVHWTQVAMNRWSFSAELAEGLNRDMILGVAGGDLSSMVVMCNACPIPDALEARQSCLAEPGPCAPLHRWKRSLPVIQAQVQGDQTDQSSEQVDAYFPCRWFLHVAWAEAAT